MTTQQIQHGKGKGKGAIYEYTKKMEKAGLLREEASRGRKSSKDKMKEFMKKEYNINDRIAKNNSHVVYFKDKCYKVTGTATFKGGYSWRCGHAKYHISPEEKNEETGEHYVFQLVGDKAVKVEDQTVEWPNFDDEIYNTIMEGRKLISEAKWRHKLHTDELALKMKDDLHHIRLGNTRKRKAEFYSDGGKFAAKKARRDEEEEEEF
jgi:hypothetical protein